MDPLTAKVDQLMSLCNEIASLRQEPQPCSAERTSQSTATFSVSINNIKYNLPSVDPTMSLNTFIRSLPKHKGTKRSCGQGGCGACTVAMSNTTIDGTQAYVSINSCLRPLISCNGRNIITVEGIGGEKNGFSPIQSRLADADGTQCGFCSPGFVMNMYSLLANNQNPTEKEVESYFDGNLCRCTGYRPIFDAFKSFASEDESSKHACLGVCAESSHNCKNVCNLSKTIPDIEEIKPLLREPHAPVLPAFPPEPKPLANVSYGDTKWLTPSTLSEVYQVLESNPTDGSVSLVFGCTGVQLLKTKPTTYVDLQYVDALKGFQINQPTNSLSFGASTTIHDFLMTLTKLQTSTQLTPIQKSILPDLLYLVGRVASTQVRHAGCIAGNLMLVHRTNFPSDLFTSLCGLNASVVIGSSQGDKTVDLLTLLQQNMNASVIKSVVVPLGVENQIYKTNKTAQRNVFSESIVNSAFSGKVATIDTQLQFVSPPTLVFGNIGLQPIRATKTEQYLQGKPLVSKAVLSNAIALLETELIPNPNVPRSKFRKSVALSMFYKFYLSILPPGLVPPQILSGASRLERGVSKGEQSYQPDPSIFPVSAPVHKLKGKLQTSGVAQYTGDIPPPAGMVYGCFVQSTVANGQIDKIDASPALALPGVMDWVSAADIPGTNVTDSQVPIFAFDEVWFVGQAIGLIVATSQQLANEAATLVKVTYKNVKTPIVTLEDAISKNSYFNIPIPPVSTGDVEKGIKESTFVLNGTVRFGGQYHNHLETQTAMAVPEEDGEMKVFCATQLTPNVQTVVANCLNVAASKVFVEVKRCGGGYGGKLTNSEPLAAAVAIAANKLGVPVGGTLELAANMTLLGKRPATSVNYTVGLNNDLTFRALKFDSVTDGGCTPPDTAGTVFVLLNSLDSCYYIPNFLASGKIARTNTPSNTSMRGPGWTPAIFFMETIIEHVSNHFSYQPHLLRERNFFKKGQTTANGTKLVYWNMDTIWSQLKQSSNFESRLAAVNQFNASKQWKKRGIAIVPVRWGAGWTGDHQESIITIYGDGTILVCHSGVEIGQGIDTKVAQTVAYKLGVDMSLVTISYENTMNSPNNSGTGGSVTSALCCKAAAEACDVINKRLDPIRSLFTALTWPQLIAKALQAGIDLQARGNVFPGPGPNSSTWTYQSYSACVQESEVDILTGEISLIRTDILFDCGVSLSPLVDIGQIEGAFVMGLGLYLLEYLNYDVSGNLLTNSVWQYQPFSGMDIPLDLRVSLLKDAPNPVGFLSSKCTGEPPLALSCVALFAVQHAINSYRASSGSDTKNFIMSSPATVDSIQTSCQVNPANLTW